MSMFQEIKQHITARQAAEAYGLKISPRGMACCPFHDDRHPSMKLNWGYYCFACGAKGDAIGYVAQMFGLSQYEAAMKIIDDLCLPIDTVGSTCNKPKTECDRQQIARKRVEHIKSRFKRWCDETVAILKQYETDISTIKEIFNKLPPDRIFSSEEYRITINAEPYIQGWLDVLCMSDDKDRQELFIKSRKEVHRIAGELKGTVNKVMENYRGDIGYRDEQCG